jgi:hypothetical protein
MQWQSSSQPKRQPVAVAPCGEVKQIDRGKLDIGLGVRGGLSGLDRFAAGIVFGPHVYEELGILSGDLPKG